MLTLGSCMNPSLSDDSGELSPANESDSPPPVLSPSAPGDISRAERAWAGVQAGVLASLLSLVWWMLAGLPNHQSIWTLPNLMGGAFYGQRSLRAGVGLYTSAGLSLHLLLCVALAVVASQLLPPKTRLGLSVLGAMLGASLWFYLWDGFFWRTVFPPYALYCKQGAIFAGFLIEGLCVGLYSLFVRSSRATNIAF